MEHSTRQHKQLLLSGVIIWEKICFVNHHKTHSSSSFLRSWHRCLSLTTRKEKMEEHIFLHVMLWENSCCDCQYSLCLWLAYSADLSRTQRHQPHENNNLIMKENELHKDKVNSPLLPQWWGPQCCCPLYISCANICPRVGQSYLDVSSHLGKYDNIPEEFSNIHKIFLQHFRVLMLCTCLHPRTVSYHSIILLKNLHFSNFWACA